MVMVMVMVIVTGAVTAAALLSCSYRVYLISNLAPRNAHRAVATCSAMIHSS
jgi:hypothetical protein